MIQQKHHTCLDDNQVVNHFDTFYLDINSLFNHGWVERIEESLVWTGLNNEFEEIIDNIIEKVGWYCSHSNKIYGPYKTEQEAIVFSNREIALGWYNS